MKISKSAFKIWKNKIIGSRSTIPIPRSSTKSKFHSDHRQLSSIKHITNVVCCSLTTTNESLEEKIEDLRKQLDELNREVEIERRKNERLLIEQRARKEELFVAATNATKLQRHSDASDKDVLNSNSNNPEVICGS